MTTQILAASGYVIAPTLVEGYSASRAGGTIVHPILGTSASDITLRAGRLRTGTLRLFFITETTARGAMNALAAAFVFTLTSTDRAIAMSFVVPEGQDIRLELDTVTSAHWHVDVPFHEVTA